MPNSIKSSDTDRPGETRRDKYWQARLDLPATSLALEVRVSNAIRNSMLLTHNDLYHLTPRVPWDGWRIINDVNSRRDYYYRVPFKDFGGGRTPGRGPRRGPKAGG